MDRKEVMEFFNHRPRNGLLITSNSEGKVNAAAYGSPIMIDEDHIVLATKEGRSFQYLRENPAVTDETLLRVHVSRQYQPTASEGENLGTDSFNRQLSRVFNFLRICQFNHPLLQSQEGKSSSSGPAPTA